MTKLFLFAISLHSFWAIAQNDSIKAISEIKSFQKQLNGEFKDPKESPLEPKDFRKFKEHSFFPINLSYRVNAKLTVTEGTPFLPLKTTTSRLANDRVYGFVEFTLLGKEFKLPVYQSQELLKTPTYADYLFFPFTDLTNGQETYSGGRYIDLRIPKELNDQHLVIDFNRAYNPSCAYNHKYSCPLVPAENQMDIEIPAGLMYKQKK